MIAEAKRPFLYFGGGRRRLGRPRGARRPLAQGLHPRGCDPDGPRMPSAGPPPLSRHDRHAREPGGQRPRRGGRPPHRGRAPASTTGRRATRRFAPCAKVLHIDADAAEINKIRAADCRSARGREGSPRGPARPRAARGREGAWAERARSLIATDSLAEPRLGLPPPRHPARA